MYSPRYEAWEAHRLMADVARHEGKLVELEAEVDLERLRRRLIKRAQRQQQPSKRDRDRAIRCIELLIELETFDAHGHRIRGNTLSDEVKSRDGKTIRLNAAGQLREDLRRLSYLVDLRLLRHQFIREEDDPTVVKVEAFEILRSIFRSEDRADSSKPAPVDPLVLVMAAECVRVVADEIRTLRQGFTFQQVRDLGLLDDDDDRFNSGGA